jgi:hypothetical protein
MLTLETITTRAKRFTVPNPEKQSTLPKNEKASSRSCEEAYFYRMATSHLPEEILLSELAPFRKPGDSRGC